MEEIDDITSNKYVEVFEYYWSKDFWIPVIPFSDKWKGKRSRFKKFDWKQKLLFYILNFLVITALVGILVAIGVIKGYWLKDFINEILFGDIIKSEKL
ncbi:MAG: hypothetical protein CL851_00190 [Crocinitomicaceae bacterium]|mgnify:CR=1 FL=1|nr:hypothetical protein [Crocinitomicaceae bacterium]|tara:strand:+ start:1239 stop:1532 length:294 start_codon:yes stop_codon:yes gene_type:complete